MWVTQSYLASVQPDAKVFIYYLFEDYSEDQSDFTNAVQGELERLGNGYRDSVALLMPSPKSADRIEAEVRGIQDFWWSLAGKLPALLISTKPLSEFSPGTAEYSLIVFKSIDAQGAAEAINSVRRLADKQLKWDFEKLPEKEKATRWRHFFDALELKPGAWGIRLDLKKLAAKRE